MADSRIRKLLGRRPGGGKEGYFDKHLHSVSVEDDPRARLSGTSPLTLSRISNDDESLDARNAPIGRQGNDYPYPDNPRGGFVLNTDPGDRLQDIANTHLSEGPTPGRIPHPWQDRRLGVLGRGITGQQHGGDTGFLMGLSGNPAGGEGDTKYIPHLAIPRGSVVARAYKRTIDDGAIIPGVYVADPTRR